jgi:YVTN family beta-propeller protein
VVFAPILPSEAALASFGLAIDQVRIIVVRPQTPPDTLVDTTVALPPDSSSLDLDIHVALLSSPETLSVSIIALSGSQPLFTGTSNVEVTSGADTPTPTEIPVDSYVGPGAGVDSIVVLPAAPFIYVNDSLRFQVQAFDSGALVTQFYVTWSTSDSGLARVNSFGVLHAPATRSSVRVRARTPGGIADSVLVTFQPVPSQLVLISGGSQSGTVGQTLGVPLTVEVRATDNLPVAGTAVRFRAPPGGAPADTTVSADNLGRASVTGVLGSGVGIQTFQINLPAFPAVTLTIGATATSGVISPAQSIITVSSGTVQSGNGVTLTLQGKDGGGNNMTSGGATVVFSFTGGISTGTIAPAPATDNGNGTYTATFTGVLAGAATTIHATIDGAPVATTLPAVTVTPGVISAPTSQVSVSSPTVAAAGTATLTLQARDAAGNALTTGGATVAFTVSGGGGSSAGTIAPSPATDNGNGTYTATFTAVTAGTPSTIGATIGAVSVTSTLPSITVTPGAASPATSVVTVSGDTVASGAIVTLRLQAKDPSGNNLTSGGATVAFSFSGGTSTGGIGVTADSGNGVYTATFTGLIAGTQTTIGATIGASAVTTTMPTVTVKPGAIAAATSVVTASTDTLASGAIATVHLRAKDAAGNLLTSGGDTVVFTASGGSSTGAISATADSGTGGYTAAFTGQGAGTATTIRASVNGATVTTALPLVTVTPGAASHIVFTVQPSPSFVGSAMAPAIEVTARDAFGNTTPAFTGAVTVAIGTNPGGGTLSGTLSHNAVAGVATFNDLQIDQPGIGYTLTASAGVLTGATSATFDMVAAAGTMAWSNPAGGNWSNPANWSGGVVPGPTDIAVITLPGTYTVTFDVNDTIAGLQLGGSSGTQTLALSSRTLGLGAGSQINANGVVSLSASTLNGPGSITNAGQILVHGLTTLNGPLSTTATSFIRLQGNGTFSTAQLTVATSFVNNGTIALTDTTSSYGAVLHLTSGTLTNSAGATIDVQVGTNGTRTLDTPLDNQGTLTVNRPLGMTKSGAVHTNSGTINVNAKLTIQQSGASPSFTNVGTILINTGDTLAVTGGSFAYSSGSISGGVWTIGSTSVSASQNFSTAVATLVLTNSTWGGAGTLTIVPSSTLTISASTLNSPVDNQGTLTLHGTTAFNAALTNAVGATLRLQGDGAFSTSNVTVANGFTNSGAIVLTDTTSSYGAALNVTSGTLTNAAGATITSAIGTGGTRALNAQLDNQGTLTLDRPLTLNKASAAHTNSGTIAVNNKFTILQTGTAPSFTNSGAINIADTVLVTGGAFTYSGGAISGPGAINFASTALTLTPNLATGTVPFSLTNTTVGGTGHVIVDPSTQLQIKGSTINVKVVNQGQLDLHGSTAINDSLTNASGATLRLQGDGALSTANVTVANSFTNNGAIVLTDTTSSYGAILNMPAGQTLTNASGATIDAALGTNGPRTLNLELNNQGTLTVNRPLTISRAGAQHVNGGTIDVSGGDLTLSQSGTTPSFTTSGTITIGAGRLFTVTSGTLNYNAGSIGGSGTLVINSATVSTTQDFSTATTALTLTNGTWGGSGKLTVAAGTLLSVRGSTINSRLANLGKVDAHGSTAFNDSVTNASGATLRLQGDGASSTSQLTVLNGFTNDGTIVLTDTTSSYGAILHVTNGTLTNAAGGLIRADSGTNGLRTIDAQLDNEGTITLVRSLTLAKASAQHVNRGTINANAKFTISQSGTTPSFRQVGTIAIGTGDTVAVTSGSFVYDSGTISGGRLTLASVSVSAPHDFSTASTALSMTGTTWGGSGTLTIAPSTALLLSGSTINSGVVNQGAVTVGGTSNLNGSVTNAAGATLRVQGTGASGTGQLTIATGFTNSGTIALTDSISSYGAVLNVTTGTLANAVGATIRSDTGTGGSRTLNALIDNSGSFIVATDAAQTTTINKAGAAHQNAGTWTIASGTLSISGAGATFANLAGGTVQGSGVFRLVGIPFSNAGGVNPGTAGTGILKIVGNYTQAVGGALNIELGGTTLGTQYDRLVDSIGTATLDGTLNVSLVNGFTPALGDTFTVLTFPARSGTIPTLNGLVLGGGIQLDTVWTANTLRLVAIVLQTTHAADITANETWTAIASPHIVGGYLKIVNGATLTIEEGATVKFDAGAGLQLGDTTTSDAGNLVMLGTPGSIHLTANTGSPVPGFWRGLEIQKASGPQTWRNVDIEYAGGTRPNLIDESCILLVDPAATVDLDSVHIRQCIHAGVHHFAGNLLVHRSEIDSVTGAGIQSFAGVLRVDSTTIRGSGQMGLIFGNGSVDLAGAVANKFTGNAGGSVQMFGHQLRGFGRQDSIAGNGFGTIGDTIVVDSGTVGAGVPAFTIYRQPAPYLVTGFLSVWSSSDVTVSLDTGLVMAFDTSAALSVGDFGDSTGTSSGNTATFVSLGTAAQPVVLRNRPGTPGWQGLFLGSQSGTPIVRHLRLVRGGYQPQLGQVCQNCLIKTTGFFEPLNTSLYVDAPNGTAPFTIDSVVSDSSHLYGIAVKRTPPQGVQLRDDSISNAAWAGLAWRGAYNPNDDISGNTLVGNHYALDITADVLTEVPSNSLTGNLTDTLLLHGGTVPVTQTLPQLGFRWRVTQPVVVDSGAVFTVAAGDTVTFDPAGSLTIGGATPSALNAVGTPGAPIVFTASSGLFWGGLEFANVSAAGAASVSNVIVEHAGTALPCSGDCQPVVFAAVRYSNVSTNPVTLDAITVRHSTLTALDVKDSAVSPLTVQNSQFYQNPVSPMIKSPNPLLLSIHGSDLYHYNGQIIQTANAGTDSIDALGNWWGDVAGLDTGFEFNDSLGRGSLWFNSVRFDLVSGPFHARGPAAQLVPATDTILANGAAINDTVGDPDSIRVRVLDAEGRGLSGTDIVWGTSTGSFQHPGLPTDEGGRAGGVWLTSTAANTQFVQATVPGLIGSPVTWAAFLQPEPTSAVNFQLVFEGPVGDTLTQGQVAPDSNSVTFTSTGRRGVFVTNARDPLGNVTHPTGFPDFCFTGVPNDGVCHNLGWFQPYYGSIDSVKADSVFFTVITASPATMQIRAEYEGGTILDSIVINMNAAAVGVRISQDTALYGSLCPSVGPYNIRCRLTFQAQLVDSAGSPLPPNDVYHFNWTNEVPGDTTVTIDSQSGLMGEVVEVTAHANGTASLVAHQNSGSSLDPDRDTLAITVNQVLANIAVTPDSMSAGLGDTVTFSATATDQGGAPMPGAVGWRLDPPYDAYLTIIDFPSASSVRVRLDSVAPSYPRDLAIITAFTERGPGDTLLAGGVLYNPIFLERSGVPGSPQGSAVDPVLNQAYVVGLSGILSVFDGVGDTLIATIPVGSGASSVAANPRTGKVYVSNSADGTVTIIDGVSRSVITTIPVATNTGGIAIDTATNLVYVGSLINVAGTDVPFLSKIDGSTDAVIATDTVRLRGASAPGAIAVNAANGRAFVIMRNDSLGVVDLVARTLVDSLGNLGFNLGGVAVNTLTSRVYVGSASEIRVIDGAPGVDTVFTDVVLGANSAQGLSVNEARNKIYVAHANNTLVYEIDGVSNQYRFIIVGTSISDTPQSTAVNPVTGKVYVPRANALTVMKYFSN